RDVTAQVEAFAGTPTGRRFPRHQNPVVLLGQIDLAEVVERLAVSRERPAEEPGRVAQIGRERGGPAWRGGAGRGSWRLEQCKCEDRTEHGPLSVEDFARAR